MLQEPREELVHLGVGVDHLTDGAAAQPLDAWDRASAAHCARWGHDLVIVAAQLRGQGHNEGLKNGFRTPLLQLNVAPSILEGTLNMCLKESVYSLRIYILRYVHTKIRSMQYVSRYNKTQ